MIAQATITDYWRAHYRMPVSSLDESLDAGWEGPAQEASVVKSDGAAELVQSILQDLPERYREVLQCRFLLNLSIKDTADRMGLSVAGVKILQYRALRHAADLEQVITAQYPEAI